MTYIGSRCIRSATRVAVVAGLLLGFIPEASLAQGPTEEDVKSAYLYYFAKFVDWPDSSLNSQDSTFVIGVVGDETLRKRLARLTRDKTLDGRKFEVISRTAKDDLSDCQILFISRSVRRYVPYMLRKLQGDQVLTVGEVEGFTASGGIIRFFPRESKIRFEINVRRGRESGLDFRSGLLRVATLTELEE